MPLVIKSGTGNLSWVTNVLFELSLVFDSKYLQLLKYSCLRKSGNISNAREITTTSIRVQ